jgi:bifunctional non-homologous end joining protein LigD
LRGKDAPFVAAPRTWAEVERDADKKGTLRQLDMDDVLARMAGSGDVFATTLSQQT